MFVAYFINLLLKFLKANSILNQSSKSDHQTVQFEVEKEDGTISTLWSPKKEDHFRGLKHTCQTLSFHQHCYQRMRLNETLKKIKKKITWKSSCCFYTQICFLSNYNSFPICKIHFHCPQKNILKTIKMSKYKMFFHISGEAEIFWAVLFPMENKYVYFRPKRFRKLQVIGNVSGEDNNGVTLQLQYSPVHNAWRYASYPFYYARLEFFSLHLPV